RPHHRLFAGTAAAVLDVRHAGLGGRSRHLPHRHRRATAAGRMARGLLHPVGPRHSCLLPARHGALRSGPGRRVRRPHLPAGTGTAPVHHPGGAGAQRRRFPAAVTRAVVFAYHNVGVRCLKTLFAHAVDVALVITHQDQPQEQIWFDSVAATAADYGIAALTPADPNAADVVARIAACRPDFLFSFYYRLLLKAPLLSLPAR